MWTVGLTFPMEGKIYKILRTGTTRTARPVFRSHPLLMGPATNRPARRSDLSVGRQAAATAATAATTTIVVTVAEVREGLTVHGCVGRGRGRVWAHCPFLSIL